MKKWQAMLLYTAICASIGATLWASMEVHKWWFTVLMVLASTAVYCGVLLVALKAYKKEPVPPSCRVCKSTGCTRAGTSAFPCNHYIQPEMK